MITEKTKKTNTKATTNQTTKPKKQNGALNLFFSLMGFVLVIGGLMGLFVPIMAHANQGEVIVEPFSCEVALADLKELQRVLEITPRTDFKYKIFLDEYESVVKSLDKHPECKELSNGN